MLSPALAQRRLVAGGGVIAPAAALRPTYGASHAFRAAVGLQKRVSRVSGGLSRPGQRRAQKVTRSFHKDGEISDWRIKQMVDTARVYFDAFLSKGHEELAPQLFDDECTHVDVVWSPATPAVGVLGMRHYLHDLRAAFPDFYATPVEFAAVDATALFVSFEGSATGLGGYHGHKASHHNSVFSGVNLMRFNADRSKIVEVRVYRSAFSEDRAEVGERELAGPDLGFRELRLKRLV